MRQQIALHISSYRISADTGWLTISWASLNVTSIFVVVGGLPP
jgi:hypothetical protein